MSGNGVTERLGRVGVVGAVRARGFGVNMVRGGSVETARVICSLGCVSVSLAPGSVCPRSDLSLRTRVKHVVRAAVGVAPCVERCVRVEAAETSDTRISESSGGRGNGRKLLGSLAPVQLNFGSVQRASGVVSALLTPLPSPSRTILTLRAAWTRPRRVHVHKCCSKVPQQASNSLIPESDRRESARIK